MVIKGIMADRAELKIIVGLGNPGIKYKNNRHNVGFMVVEELGKRFRALFKRNFLLSAFLTKIKLDGTGVILIKPRTFMNNSGLCVKRALSRYKVSKADLLVVYDDVDLPQGALRFRKKGSSGGHKGMESIAKALDSQEVNRLRIGIGRIGTNDLTDYVLSDFSLNEQAALEGMFDLAACACMDWVKHGSDYVMARYNKTIT